MDIRTGILDIETDGLNPSVIFCAVLKDADSGHIQRFTGIKCKDSTIRHTFLAELATFDRLVIHNGIDFDLPVINNLLGYSYQGEVIDTLVQSRMQNPNRELPEEYKNQGVKPHSLQAWGIRLGHPKVEHDDWTEFSPEMLHRCTEDVELLHKVYAYLEEERQQGQWGDSVRLICRLLMNLKRQEDNGFPVDMEQLDKSIYFLQRWMDKVEAALEPYLPVVQEILEKKVKGEYTCIKKPFLKNGEPAKSTLAYYGKDAGMVKGPFCRVSYRKVSLDSAVELKEFLLDKGWKPTHWNTNSAGDRTSPKLSVDDPFNGVQQGLGSLAGKYAQCKQRKGVLEGWKDKVRLDGRMPTKISGFTVTYRARHRGIVNIPRPSTFFGGWMRKCFVPQKGWVQVGIDADGCQARMLASRMGDAKYTELVVAGNMHSYNQEMADLPSRDKAKEFFYALLFGASNRKLGEILKVSQEAAEAKRNKLLKNIPALARVIDELASQWRSRATPKYNYKFKRTELANGWVRGLDGRKVFIPSEHTILVNTLQADEATLMAVAYNMLHKMLDAVGLHYGEDYGMLIWYHDEFQIECKPELADDIGKLACKAIAEAGKFLRLKCPQQGDYKIGKNWSETH